MAKSQSPQNTAGDSLDPFKLDSFYAKTVVQENKGQVGLYPAQCNGSVSSVPSSMTGDTRNVQEGP